MEKYGLNGEEKQRNVYGTNAMVSATIIKLNSLLKETINMNDHPN